jgi:hypothetical protein
MNSVIIVPFATLQGRSSFVKNKIKEVLLTADNEKWQKKVWFSVRPPLNLNRTALNLNRWSGSKFGTLLEPNLKSSSRFGKNFREPDRTELRHP